MSAVLSRLRTWLREPFARFVLIGIVLFAADRALNGAPDVRDTRRIVITEAEQQALLQAYRAERGRAPDAAEWQARLDQWISDQVLYREALRLGLDRKDVIVRRQLTQKMRFLLEDSAPLPVPGDDELQAWLVQHAQRYERAPTWSFDQVFVSRGRHGDALNADADKIHQQLMQASESFASLGDAFPTGATIASASPMQIRREFGPEMVDAVRQAPAGQWAGPYVSSFGLHFIRVTAVIPAKPAALAEVREQVLTDYTAELHARRTRESIAQLRKRYRIDVESVSP